MVFYLIGLGLGDVDDISVKALNIIRRCAEVYLESYTSVLSHGVDRTKLAQFYGRPVLEADRRMVELQSARLLDAWDKDIALLVVGDPFGATTHADLLTQAAIGSELRGPVPFKVIHNASILTAVGCCGLQLYSFGCTVSIPMWTDGWEPDSFLDKIIINRLNGMHTLCLLDIKIKEQSVENMMKQNQVYEPPRFMSCAQAADQICKALQKRGAEGQHKDVLNGGDTPVVGLARVGWDDQQIFYGTLNQMTTKDMGPPLHCLIIPAREFHPIEKEMLFSVAERE